MGLWSIRGIDSELKVREDGDFISLLFCPDKIDDAWSITMTYQEFMDLAGWLGFNVKPRSYLELPGVESKP